ncbi:hypothetical protein BXZ70DRAFT_525335 [Cristinia sonorae]|uniref:Uncharacterized protein n=1 Tax=Cristinia sonorae TaxID=1940300 RepID=A0A8K0UV63_9AGAR|nr:hypothetical protein BXZ70DRAFT_525335 [Cristinia sonorae]
MLQSQAMLQCPRCSVPQADKTPNQETGWDAATFGDFGLGGHGLERCDTDSSADVTMTCVDDQTLRSFSPFPEIQFDSILDSEPPLQMEVAIAAFGSLQIPDSPPRPFANALHGEHHPRAPSSSTSDDQQSSSDAEEEVEAQEVLAKLEANDNDEVPLPMAASETEDESRSSTSPAHTVTAYKSSSFPYQHIMHNDSYPSVPYFPWPTARRNIKKLLTGRAEYGNDVPMAGNKHLEVFTE